MDKSHDIYYAEDDEVAKAAFDRLGLDITISHGQAYLDDFISSTATKYEELGNNYVMWEQVDSALAKVAIKYPQTSYDGFCYCLLVGS